MRFSSSLFQLLALIVTLAVLASTAQIGVVLAGDACGDDPCCEGDSPDQAPCSGAADDCDCPCCPLPVIGEALFPLDISSQPVPVILAPGWTPASGLTPSFDHPPE